MNTILMIDDDIQYMNTIRDYLTKQDFIVYCANSFKTALPYMKESNRLCHSRYQITG